MYTILYAHSMKLNRSAPQIDPTMYVIKLFFLYITVGTRELK